MFDQPFLDWLLINHPNASDFSTEVLPCCGMCAVSSWEGGKRSEDMELLQLKRILENRYGITEVKLTGLGEPMLQGDEYFI